MSGRRGGDRGEGRTPGAGRPIDPLSFDVAQVVQRTVTSLYSHLVTRPTGRAVRLAIESRVVEAGTRSVSLVDMSEVRVLDFSCADEVVAKLLQRFSDQRFSEGGHTSERGVLPEAFFVFRGVRDEHRDPIETVLNRQSLVAVAETRPSGFELLGAFSEGESRVWSKVEERGCVSSDEVADLFSDHEYRGAAGALKTLVRRRVVLHLPERREYRSLSAMVS